MQKDFAAGVYLSEAQNSIPPPPLHIVYANALYLFTQEGRGGELNREKVRGATVHTAGSKIPT